MYELEAVELLPPQGPLARVPLVGPLDRDYIASEMTAATDATIPARAGLPAGPSAVALMQAGHIVVPGTGMPVLALHGPFPIRAALAVAGDELLVRPLPPLVPSTRLHRRDIAIIQIERGHWYAFGRIIICIRREKGPTLRLMSPPLPGVPDGGETLGRILRAWWRAGT